MECPCSENDFQARHVAGLLASFRALTGRNLIAPTGDPVEDARRIFEAPFLVLSHDGAADPVLTYGNRSALQLFEMAWEDFVKTPSRFTAEAPNREERQRLLTAVSENGFIDDYSGVRISAKGKRFRIHQATVWNVAASGGQAATFSDWSRLED